MGQNPEKTEVIYSARFTERELNIFERLTSVLEDFADAVRSESGLEGGKSLLSTANRMFDQIAFHHEASTRHVEMSTELNKTYIQLLQKQVENQEKMAKSIEEVKKAQAGQASAIQSLDRRFKNIEGGASQQGGQQKAPFRDGRTKPHHNRSPKAEIATSPAVPTTNEQNAKKDSNEEPAPKPKESSETAKDKFANNALQEQVQKLQVAV